MDFHEVIAKRRTVRNFKGPATEAQLMRILAAGAKAPSGSNQQRWEFIVVDDPALIEKIAERKYVLNRGNKPRGEEAATPEVEKAARHRRTRSPTPATSPSTTRRGAATRPGCVWRICRWRPSPKGWDADRLLPAGAEKDIDTLLQVPPGYELACVLSIGVPATEPTVPQRRPEGSWLHRNKF